VNRIITNLASAGKNAHVSVPAALAFGCEIGSIWFSKWKPQFDATKVALIGYAALAAANSGPANPPAAQPPQKI